MPHSSLIVLMAFLVSAVTPGQLLPPPGDRDIRAVYWELRDQSEVWLTLEARNAKGEHAPLLTFTYHFSGKRPAAPPSEIEVRAFAGTFAAPRVEFWLLLNGKQRIDLVPAGVGMLLSGTPSDYLSARIPIASLRDLADAEQISGNALGSEFELSQSQREAIKAFLDRVLSPNPAQQPKRQAPVQGFGRTAPGFLNFAPAFSQETRPHLDAVLLVGGHYGARTRWAGSAGVLIARPRPFTAGSSPDSSRDGLVVKGSAGAGGFSLAGGGTALALEGPFLTTGLDALVTLTRTGQTPRAASAESTYVGAEVGLIIMSARVSGGIARRAAGPAGAKGTIFTWSVGAQIPLDW